MEEHHLPVRRTARYYSWGADPAQARYIWIACHGYGQLARRFLRRFDQLDPGQHLILAPEGLSRFYWKGLNDQPVASWMTREDRLHEIEDYCEYLDRLLATYLPLCPEDVRLVGLGFSQGVATIMRWLIARRPPLAHLIAWAGSPPDDIDYEPHRQWLASIDKYFIYGTQDPFLTEERLRALAAFNRQQHLDFSVETFEGNHRLDRQTLAQLAQQLV